MIIGLTLERERMGGGHGRLFALQQCLMCVCAMCLCVSMRELERDAGGSVHIPGTCRYAKLCQWI